MILISLVGFRACKPFNAKAVSLLWPANYMVSCGASGVTVIVVGRKIATRVQNPERGCFHFT